MDVCGDDSDLDETDPCSEMTFMEILKRKADNLHKKSS